ncbi:hypothetical protein BH20CHL3_BH20CHL3_12460 [soil metagenome]
MECLTKSKADTDVFSFPALGSIPLEVDFPGGRLITRCALAQIAEEEATLVLTTDRRRH